MRMGAGFVHRCGLIAAVALVGWIHSRWIAPDRYDLLVSGRLKWWIVVGASLVGAAHGLGLPDQPKRRGEAALRAMAAVGIAASVVSLAQLAMASPLLPRSSMVLLFAIVPIWSVLAWNLDKDSWARASNRDRLFVVSQYGSELASLEAEVGPNSGRPVCLVGQELLGSMRSDQGGRTPLVDAVTDSGATVLVLDSAAQADESIIAQASDLHRSGVRVRTLANFYEQWLGRIPMAELARASLLFDIGELHRQRYVRSRRIVDVVFGLVGMIVLVPTAGVVAVVNLFANRGSLFYSQTRVGKDAELFTIYKFRTMKPAGLQAASPGRPEAVAPKAPTSQVTTVWTEPNDPRITRFGRLLRRCHLDELPQVINVFNGELSIVGPRPEQPHYVAELESQIPLFSVRHMVRPGLTGWAQIRQGYAASNTDAAEKLQYDVYYLRHQGLPLDLFIIWQTIRGVMGGGGR